MAQLIKGLVSVANGTNRVVGNAAVDWSTVVPGYSLFSLQGAGQTVFIVQTVEPPSTPTASGFWELTLADAGAGNTYTGPTVAGAAYFVHKDFEPTFGFPQFAYGDFVPPIFNRFVLQVVALFGAGFPTLLPSFAIATIPLPKPKLFIKIATQNGATILQWWLLENSPPDSANNDVATSDDVTSRFRQVG